MPSFLPDHSQHTGPAPQENHKKAAHLSQVYATFFTIVYWKSFSSSLNSGLIGLFSWITLTACPISSPQLT